MNPLKKLSIHCFLAAFFAATSACAATTPVAETEPIGSTDYISDYDYYDGYSYGYDTVSPDDDWFYDYYDTNDLYDPVTDYDYGWDDEEFGWDDEGVFDDGVL